MITLFTGLIMKCLCSSYILVNIHWRSQDFSKGGSHCVKVRVLVCLDIFKLKRHGIFTTCSGLFG